MRPEHEGHIWTYDCSHLHLERDSPLWRSKQLGFVSERKRKEKKKKLHDKKSHKKVWTSWLYVVTMASNVLLKRDTGFSQFAFWRRWCSFSMHIAALKIFLDSPEAKHKLLHYVAYGHHHHHRTHKLASKPLVQARNSAIAESGWEPKKQCNQASSCSKGLLCLAFLVACCRCWWFSGFTAS